MRIRLEQSGGFAAIPALRESVEVDTCKLTPDETATLEELVHGTGLLEGSLTSVGGGVTGADLMDYALTVDDGDVVRTVRLRDPLDDPAVAALVDRLGRYRGRARGDA